MIVLNLLLVLSAIAAEALLEDDPPSPESRSILDGSGVPEDAPFGAASATTVAPAVTSALPTVTLDAPAVTTAAPIVATASPTVTTTAPVVTTAAPTVTTAVPTVTTAMPAVTTAAPTVSTAAPAVTTAAATEVPAKEPPAPSSSKVEQIKTGGRTEPKAVDDDKAIDKAALAAKILSLVGNDTKVSDGNYKCSGVLLQIGKKYDYCLLKIPRGKQPTKEQPEPVKHNENSLNATGKQAPEGTQRSAPSVCSQPPPQVAPNLYVLRAIFGNAMTFKGFLDRKCPMGLLLVPVMPGLTYNRMSQGYYNPYGVNSILNHQMTLKNIGAQYQYYHPSAYSQGETGGDVRLASMGAINPLLYPWIGAKNLQGDVTSAAPAVTTAAATEVPAKEPPSPSSSKIEEIKTEASKEPMAADDDEAIEKAALAAKILSLVGNDSKVSDSDYKCDGVLLQIGNEYDYCLLKIPKGKKPTKKQTEPVKHNENSSNDTEKHEPQGTQRSAPSVCSQPPPQVAPNLHALRAIFGNAMTIKGFQDRKCPMGLLPVPVMPGLTSNTMSQGYYNPYGTNSILYLQTAPNNIGAHYQYYDPSAYSQGEMGAHQQLPLLDDTNSLKHHQYGADPETIVYVPAFIYPQVGASLYPRNGVKNLQVDANEIFPLMDHTSSLEYPSNEANPQLLGYDPGSYPQMGANRQLPLLDDTNSLKHPQMGGNRQLPLLDDTNSLKHPQYGADPETFVYVPAFIYPQVGATQLLI